MSANFADNYPAERTFSESERLHNQHALVVHALGGLILCPLDTHQRNLRILDIGSADGWFLHSVRKELAYPDSAILIGTDVAPYPNPIENVIVHNFKDPFPEEWRASFDFVHLRAVMASAGEVKIDVVRRALELVKPGGWIQLVDARMLTAEDNGPDKPSQKICEYLGVLLRQAGMDYNSGEHIAEHLKIAGGDGIVQQGSKKGLMRVGKGSETLELSRDWLQGFCSTSGKGIVKKGIISQSEFNQLQMSVYKEAEQLGFNFPWWATWAQRED